MFEIRTFDVLVALGYCLFIWVAYVLATRIFCGEWIWQAWKQKKERGKEFEKWKEKEGYGE